MQRALANALKNSALLLAGGVAALALCELAIRVLDLPPKPLPALNEKAYRLSQNPSLRFEYIPGYEDTAHDSADPMAYFKINADGFRDHPHNLAKQPGTKRILVFGDSITAGNGLRDADQTFARLLQDKLPGSETFNMGVGGYNTAQEAETLRAKGLKYRPDIVILAFCINDFSWQASVYNRLRAQMTPDQDAILSGNAALRSDWLRATLDHSRLAFFTYYRIASLVKSPDAPATTETNPVESGFAALAALQRENEFEAWVFIIPGLDSLFSEYPHVTIHRDVFNAATPYPGIRVVDLLPYFARHNDNPSGLSIDGLHPNEEGHKLVAEFIADALTNGPDPKTTTSTIVESQILIRNGSFEVATNGAPATWFTREPETVNTVSAPDAPHGATALSMLCPTSAWVSISQTIRVRADDRGRTLRITAHAKSATAGALSASLRWKVGEEFMTTDYAWNAHANAWQQESFTAVIPEDTDPESGWLTFTVRPTNGVPVLLDDVQVARE